MSGGNANTTISDPTRGDWKILWGNGPFDNFQLDIVGFLAVLGEGSVLANYQVSALSRLFYLPRIIPAPQALLPSKRPTELPSRTAWVTGVFSGNHKEHIHHVAGILLENSMKPFEVRCVDVRKKKTKLKRATTLDSMVDSNLRGVPHQAKKEGEEAPTVKAKATGPLAIVTVLGFLMSLALLIASLLWGDGMSFLATLLLSFLSTLIGAANKCTLKLPQRKGPDPTAGDTVIRYRNGSFLVVRCDETVARELYFAPEEIQYNITNPTIYRMISLVGTVMLMLGVVTLANSKLQLQFAWAGAYIFINALYWVAAAVPERLHWDLSDYEVEEQSIDGGCHNANFTQALWKAILVTKSTRWAQTGKAAPHTDVWDEWLERAEKKAQSVEPHTITGAPKYKFIWNDGPPAKQRVIWNVPRNAQGEEWDAKRDWDLISKGIDPDNPPTPPEESTDVSDKAPPPQNPPPVKWRHKILCNH